MRRLAQQWNGELTVFVERDLSERRQEQGWDRPDYSPASLVIEPSRSERKAHLDQTTGSEDVHFFSGLHAYPDTYWTLKQAIGSNAELGVLLEAGRPNDGLKSYLRRMRDSVHGLRWRKHLDYVLAMGNLGIRWYQSCQFPISKIHSWGYFVEPNVGASPDYDAVSNDIYTITFVGSLKETKGVDILITALSTIKDSDWELVICGDGAKKRELEQQSQRSELDEHIRFLGARDYINARSIMATSDLLVLPSRYDGWGAVVNEALHEGTPVVTTEMCGAADLIQDKMLGTIVPAGDSNALSTAIENRMKSGQVTKTTQKRIQNWTKKSITPVVAAEYLIKILNSKGSPVPPWHRSHKLS